jgi:putative FmdB family regulatory protein
MPTYDYRCDSCGEHVEVYQSFSDDPLSTCGLCGGELKRVFHPVGIVFKGSGFYSTDSRRNQAGAKSEMPSSASKSSSSGSESAKSDGANSGQSKADASKSNSGQEAKIA